MRSYIWIMICLLTITMVIIIYASMKKQYELQQLKYHEEMIRLQLTNIRNRISPHFLFNVLNKEMGMMDDSPQTNLMNLVTLLRMSLEMTEQCFVSLSQELTFAKTYIQLERKSLGDEFLLEWNIDPAIPTDHTWVPTMILQIPIENAVKHALRGKEGVKRLSVSIRRKENGSQLLICDNGAGFRPYINPHSANTGTGLKTLYQTIDLLNIRNEEKILFTIFSSDSTGHTGTQVSVFIPDKYRFE